MPIPDEARQALHAAVDAGWRTSWGDSYVDVDEFLVGLSERGYTVVKVTDLAGVLDVMDQAQVDWFADPTSTVSMHEFVAAAVLALLRGEGQ